MSFADGCPVSSLIALRRLNSLKLPGAKAPRARIRSAISSMAAASSTYWAMNSSWSVVNIGPVTFQWKFWVFRYRV